MYKVPLDDVNAWLAQQEDPGESVEGRRKEKMPTAGRTLRESRSLQWMLGKDQTMAETSAEGCRAEEQTASSSPRSSGDQLFASDFISVPYKTGYPPFESHATISAILVGEIQRAIIPVNRSGVGSSPFHFSKCVQGRGGRGTLLPAGLQIKLGLCSLRVDVQEEKNKTCSDPQNNPKRDTGRLHNWSVHLETEKGLQSSTYKATHRESIIPHAGLAPRPNQCFLFHMELCFHIYCCECLRATRSQRVQFLTQLESTLVESRGHLPWGVTLFQCSGWLAVLWAKNANPRAPAKSAVIKPWLNFPPQNKVSQKVPTKSGVFWENNHSLVQPRKGFQI